MSYSERTLEGNWAEDKFGKHIVEQGGDPREMIGKFAAPVSSYEVDFKDRFDKLDKAQPAESATSCLSATLLFTHCPDMKKQENLGQREFHVNSKYFYQDPSAVKLGDIHPEHYCAGNPKNLPVTWVSTYKKPERYDPYATTSASDFNKASVANAETVARHPRMNGECAKSMNANWRNMALRQ